MEDPMQSRYQAVIVDGKMELDITELLSSLTPDEQIEVAKHLAIQPAMLDCIVKHLINGKLPEGSWLTREDLQDKRQEIIEGLAPIAHQAVQRLLEMRDYYIGELNVEHEHAYKALMLLRENRIALPSRPARRPHRKIVTLSGSSRFIEVMAIVGWMEEKKGSIVQQCHLLPHWYEVPGRNSPVPEHHLAEVEGCAKLMDAIHLDKIKLSDELLVIDVWQYVGESTKKEIQFALDHSKTVRFMSHEPEYRGVLDQWDEIWQTRTGEKCCDGTGFITVSVEPLHVHDCPGCSACKEKKPAA
jgi:hypothetical protein